MDLPDRLQGALQRLDGALDALDAAVERRDAADAARADAAAGQGGMQDDRARLAAERDAALARARSLDRAAEQVSARLDRVGADLRDILAEVDAGAPPVPA